VYAVPAYQPLLDRSPGSRPRQAPHHEAHKSHAYVATQPSEYTEFVAERTSKTIHHICKLRVPHYDHKFLPADTSLIEFSLFVANVLAPRHAMGDAPIGRRPSNNTNLQHELIIFVTSKLY